MKGYWHLPALAIVMSFLTITHHNYVYFIGFVCWLCYLFYQKRLRKTPLLISLVFYFIFLFYIPQITLPQDNSSTLSDPFIMGEIITPPTITDQYLSFVLQERKTKSKMIVYHFSNDKPFISDEFTHVKYGALCQVNVIPKIPDQSRNPGQFDYQTYLLKQGISYEAIVDSPHDLQCNGSKFMNVIYSFRMKLIHYVTDLLSKETSSWLKALVLGDDSSLGDHTIDLFQRWSLSHILAISGLHVGLVIGLVYFLLVKLNVVTKETAQWIVIIFLPIYAFLAGGAPSVWRASLMGLIFLILAKVRIQYSVTDVLSIIFISLILIDHYIVYNIGFQFSFLVTFGLILSRRWLFENNSTPWQILKISFVAQMMIVPLQISYFSTFHPMSILLNSLVVPYFSLFVIPSMFLLLLLSPLFPKFALIFDHIFSIFQKIMINMLQFIDTYLYFPWIIGELSMISIIIYYILFVVVMNYLERNQLKKAFRFSLFIVFLFLGIVIRPYFSSEGIVTMLDIGQGDAYVIELPYRKGVFFVDAGATFSFQNFEASSRNFDQIIRPYLYSRGITEVDAVFISHEDLDHNGSIPFMIEQMNVKKVIISEFYQFNERETEVILKNNVQVNRVAVNEDIMIAGQPFSILAPIEDQFDENENSLVFKTTLGGMNWLFTGDIGKEIERQLVMDQELMIDVLKVAHHGSNTSTDPQFIQGIKPKYAFISVGKNNRYGHPTTEVISTLRNNGVTILRTDEHGAVQYRYIHNQGTFYKYLP